MPNKETPQNTREVLQSRAKALAKPVHRQETAEAEETIETLTFLMADEDFGVELRFVRAILPLKQLTPIPGVPAHISGVINVRGEILSVMDLRLLFELKSGAAAASPYVMLLSSPDMVFGIQAQKITGIQHIPINTLQPGLPTITGVREKYLKGLTDSGMALLDGEKLLTDEDLLVYQTTD